MVSILTSSWSVVVPATPPASVPATGTTGSVFPGEGLPQNTVRPADETLGRSDAKPFDQTNGLVDTAGESDGTALSDTSSGAWETEPARSPRPEEALVSTESVGPNVRPGRSHEPPGRTHGGPSSNLCAARTSRPTTRRTPMIAVLVIDPQTCGSLVRFIPLDA